MKNFLKVTCKYQKISSIYDILEAYGNYSRKQKGILKAVLTYVTKPEEAQKEKMEDFLRREFGAKEVILTSQRRQIFDRRLHSYGRRQRVRLESQRTL